MQLGPAAESFRVMCDRSPNPGDHRNGSRVLSRSWADGVTRRMRESFIQNLLSHSIYDRVGTRVLGTLSVISLDDLGDDRPRLIQGRQGEQRYEERTVAGDPPTHRTHPSRNFRGREKVSSISFVYRPPPNIHFFSHFLTSRTDASTQFHSHSIICSQFITFLRPRLPFAGFLSSFRDRYPACQPGMWLRIGHARLDGRLSRILVYTLLRPFCHLTRLEV